MDTNKEVNFSTVYHSEKRFHIAYGDESCLSLRLAEQTKCFFILIREDWWEKIFALPR
jgi:PIN domain nuclease of toxin-antitoxin system